MEKVPSLVERALNEADLPDNPQKVIGAAFLFVEGDHFIGGIIRSIGYGPTEGIILYVSTPRFRGMDIRRLCRRDGAWVLEGAARGEYKEGDFILLA